ncbi:MAG: CRTAC1 family protein [Chloroflexi bacterium]|nr:CRTAC1 family protein [Chloroflexota bacterium]
MAKQRKSSLRYWALGLSVLAALILVACGGEESAGPTPAQVSSTQAPIQEPTEAPPTAAPIISTPTPQPPAAEPATAPPAATVTALPSPATDETQVTFENIANQDGAGISYRRAPSATVEVMETFRQQSLQQPLRLTDLPAMPHRVYGISGVAILDHDRDGDLDIYVTNGPGAPNSLYSNQLIESGSVTFLDVAESAGVAATDQDSTGVCYGDTDNDGDHDLLVLGRSEPNRLFENQADGTFTEVLASGVGGGDLSSVSCSLGDVNGDGLLDVVVANTFDFATLFAIFAEPFNLNQHNQLFINQGGNTFTDASASSGIQNLAGFPPDAEGAAAITWAVSVVDVDLDGDVDIIFADDQGAMPPTLGGGVDRGFIHVLLNDGAGNFTDRPVIDTPAATGGWMGLGFGDFNCDGHLDMFGSNFGDYNIPAMAMPYELGEQPSRWLLGTGDGSFTDPGVGDLVASVFGWGNAVFDYDNDGDSDIVFNGGLEMNFMTFADNPGVVLRNQDCSSNFTFEDGVFDTDYIRLNVQGLAVGDLNQDGFVDIVTASNVAVPEAFPLIPSPAKYDSVFDSTAFFTPQFAPSPEGFTWTEANLAPGIMTIEINSGQSENGWISLTAVGSVDLTDVGRVNRDGIGAVVFFTPENGDTVITPIQGGSSFASQHSLEVNFGLGSAKQGTVEVLWPGGVRNRLYGISAGERVVIPEIPCSFSGEWSNQAEYEACVGVALADLVSAGIISDSDIERYSSSALQAFLEP